MAFGSIAIVYYIIRYITVIIQIAHELDDEEAWLREKLLQTKSEDYGRDLPSTQNLRKRHKRLETELISHEQVIENLSTSTGRVLPADLESRRRDLVDAWRQLKALVEVRDQRLEENVAYFRWLALIDEEIAWLHESTGLIIAECGESLPQAQGLIKKHEAFETDLKVHIERAENQIKKVL